MGKDISELSFEKKVDKLAVELKGKLLRREWSVNRENLKKKYVMTTQELHKAFGLIGSGVFGKRAAEIKKATEEAAEKNAAAKEVLEDAKSVLDKEEEAPPADVSDYTPPTDEETKGWKKANWQAEYVKKYGREDEGLTVALLKEAIIK